MHDPLDNILEVENPAEVLRNETGIFEVTSPYGHTFQVTCTPGTRMSVREIGVPKRAEITPGPGASWKIRRVKQAVA
jgi:hypothetical protein